MSARSQRGFLDIGATVQRALKPGGAVGRVADDVGQAGKQALGPGAADDG